MQVRLQLFLLIVTAFVLPLNAHAESPALTAARATAAKAEADADKARTAAILAAKKKLLEAVNAALKSAMQSGDLATANTLDVERKTLEGTITALASGGIPMKATIAANQPWQQVGKVKAGQVIETVATGQWKMGQSIRWKLTGPEGAMDRDGMRGRLIARVGDQQWFVAETKRVTVQKDGVLEMRPEDGDAGLNDNSGALSVEVTTVIPEADPATTREASPTSRQQTDTPSTKAGELFVNPK